MSVILDNAEYKFKIVTKYVVRYNGDKIWICKNIKKEIIKCFINQYQKDINKYIKIMKDEKINNKIWKVEKNGIPQNNIYVSIDSDFIDYFIFAHQKKLTGDYWDKVNGKCFLTLYYPYTNDELDTYSVHPEYRTLKEYLKNKIVDKYLIDDIRDLIII